MTVAAIISAIRSRSAGTPTSALRTRSMPSWLRAVLQVILVVMLFGLYGVAVWGLWQVWSTGAWDSHTFVISLQSVVGILTIHSGLTSLRPKTREQTPDPAEAVQMLRLTAAAGGDELAPPVELPPIGTLGIADMDVAVTSTIPPVKPALRWALVAAILLLPLMGVACVGFVAWLWTLPPQPGTDVTWLPIFLFAVTFIVGGLGVGSFGLGVYALWRTVREPLNPVIRGDALGLHQQPRRGLPDASIEWVAARSLFKIEDVLQARGIGRPGLTLYALDAGDRLIAWTVAGRATQEQRAASDRLCHLIAERTRLPLRDLTRRAEEVSNVRVLADLVRGTVSLEEALPSFGAHREARGLYRVGGRNVPGGHPAAPSLAPLPPAVSYAVARLMATSEVAAIQRSAQRVRAPWWRRALFIMSAAAVVLVLPGSWALHQAQIWYYDRFATQIAASTPLYADPLTTDDGQWYTHALTDKDTEFTFAGGTYLVQSDARGDGGEAYAPGTYGDIAVEVTLRERPTNWNTTVGSLNTAGVVVRDTNGSAVRCGTNPIGTWYLMRYSSSLSENDQWSLLATGEQNRDVHWGFGIANTLLLVTRGQRYWCYANGHLLGMGTDSISLQPGHVGIYLDDDTIYATYNDFRVYAAPAGM